MLKAYKKFINEAVWNDLATKAEIKPQKFNKDYLGDKVGTFDGKDHYIFMHDAHTAMGKTFRNVHHRLVEPGNNKASVTIKGSTIDDKDFHVSSMTTSGGQNTHGFMKHLVKHHHPGVYADSVSPGVDKIFRRYHNDPDVQLHGKDRDDKHYQYSEDDHQKYYSAAHHGDELGIKAKVKSPPKKKTLLSRILKRK